MTIDHGQQRQLQRAVGDRVMERDGHGDPGPDGAERKPCNFQGDLSRPEKPVWSSQLPRHPPGGLSLRHGYIEAWVEPAELRTEHGREWDVDVKEIEALDRDVITPGGRALNATRSTLRSLRRTEAGAFGGSRS